MSDEIWTSDVHILSIMRLTKTEAVQGDRATNFTSPYSVLVKWKCPCGEKYLEPYKCTVTILQNRVAELSFVPRRTIFRWATQNAQFS